MAVQIISSASVGKVVPSSRVASVQNTVNVGNIISTAITTIGTPVGNFILMESSGYILLEDGSKIILE
ncbi:MAG TPA: hypothetical protein PK059_02105 [Cyclobacteriaceae bacterium]|nr:hypothetical protein [Cyclobacteriaceae bacterium]